MVNDNYEEGHCGGRKRTELVEKLVMVLHLYLVNLLDVTSLQNHPSLVASQPLTSHATTDEQKRSHS
jgi:hypothetical protein